MEIDSPVSTTSQTLGGLDRQLRNKHTANAINRTIKLTLWAATPRTDSGIAITKENESGNYDYYEDDHFKLTKFEVVWL